jgi:phosphoglycerate dehydrogenase-like enzyme
MGVSPKSAALQSLNPLGFPISASKGNIHAITTGNRPMTTNAFTFLMLPPQNDLYRAWARRLSDTVPGVNVVVAETADDVEANIASADAAFGTMTPSLLAKATKLRWLQAPQAAPPAGYYFPELIAHKAPVTNFRQIFNDHISAHIVGLGGIGTETARLLNAFGVTVLALDARRESKPDFVAEMHPPEALDTQLPRADFVILTVPHTPATEGFFNTSRFNRMKPSAFFINIGRGMTTKLDDLVGALRGSKIAGAALDVYEIEPLPADHPLWTMPNVLLTPHMAGYGPHLNDRRFEIIQDNCRAFADGKPLRNVVDKANWF